MVENARYVHTNLIARDWRELSEFYIRGRLTVGYVTDPEGNIVELQRRG